MNTAARMETHSKPNRIHVSESTANLLRKAGKGHWVLPRKDKIRPKGKQEMQTYFVNPRADRSVASGSIMDISSRSSDTAEESIVFGLDRMTTVNF